MKVNKWTLGLAAVGLISAPCLLQAEEKLSPVMTALSSTTISGYVDTSAHWDLGTGNANAAPFIYNQGKQDGFNLNRVKLTVEKPLDEAQWSAGYRTDLWFGPDANVLGTQSPLASGTDDFAIQQAYVKLRAPVGNGLDFNMGVFDSIIGYESHDNVLNDNYTRSYATGWEPRSHTGVLAKYQVFDSLAVAGGVANTMGPSINQRPIRQAPGGNAYEAETHKTYMGSAELTVPESFGFLAGSSVYAGIVEGFGSANEDQANWYVGARLNTPITGLKVGLAYDSVDDLQLAGGQLANGDSYAVYASFQATEKLSFHARGEYASAFPGQYAPAASVANPSPWTNEKFDVLALTGTVQYDLWKNVLTRLEVRWDHVTEGPNGGNLFGGTANGRDDLANGFQGANKRNNITIAANVVYKF